jgi:lysophospholipase L1-like esterase
LSRFVVGPLAVALVLIGAPRAAAGGADAPAPPVTYYLALGDSLAQGVQPIAAGHSVKTNQGYADDLWSRYHAGSPGLRLAKLGCPGETTGTMILGGICSYPLGSQLAQATAFLATHQVAFVTLDIGANNLDSCVSAAGLDQACLARGLAAANHDLPLILQALRRAGPHVAMFAMNYYDPFVAAALKGGAFAALAIQSEAIAASFNQTLAAAYASFGLAVADVAAAFAPLTIASMPALDLPVDLVTICALTWMCAPSPIGPNIHANAAGYTAIAVAFERKIG